MSVRPFSWRDLISLQRVHGRSVFLYSALVLTRGALAVPGALVSSLMPSLGITTYVLSTAGRDNPIFGQVMHRRGSPFAHLTFLAPDAALDSPDMADLLDALVSFSGENGAYHLLAEVDEKTDVFESLRLSSFAIYTRQRIWQFDRKALQVSSPKAQPGKWRPVVSKNTIAIRSLYNNLVPPLVQQVEPFSYNQNLKGWVYERGGELLGFAAPIYGPRGIWLQPFIHPDAEDAAGQVHSLLLQMPQAGALPYYVCVRSYQSWLEPTLEELGASAGPRQAVMAKHLALLQKAARSLTVQAIENSQPEASAPVARTES